LRQLWQIFPAVAAGGGTRSYLPLRTLEKQGRLRNYLKTENVISEPFALLKDKLREESLILANETLRFAQSLS